MPSDYRALETDYRIVCRHLQPETLVGRRAEGPPDSGMAESPRQAVGAGNEEQDSGFRLSQQRSRHAV